MLICADTFSFPLSCALPCLYPYVRFFFIFVFSFYGLPVNVCLFCYKLTPIRCVLYSGFCFVHSKVRLRASPLSFCRRQLKCAGWVSNSLADTVKLLPGDLLLSVVANVRAGVCLYKLVRIGEKSINFGFGWSLSSGLSHVGRKSFFVVF